ncbi:MAG: alpha/beta hydrolase [Ilumatobacter sp.]|nr:alpha/beta hydrolase [Ilumatobacter sp.]
MSEPSDPDTAVEAVQRVEIEAPSLPPGRIVHLADRGDVVVRDFGGRPGAPTVCLLHGWTASADLNFFRCYDAVGRDFRVFAFDHRGHAAGLRTKTPFRLEDCADDVVGVADELGIDTFIPVGYSMGGPIAKLVWRRHPDRVDGMVLCATAPFFSTRRDEKLSFLGLAGLATLAKYTPEQARSWLTDQLYLQRKSEHWEPWAVAESASHDWRTLLDAGRAIGRFSSADWLDEIDVPTSVLITMNDSVIPLARQVKLFEMIPGAEAFRVDGDHDAVVADADRFVPTLLRALAAIEARLAARADLVGLRRPDVTPSGDGSA